MYSGDDNSIGGNLVSLLKFKNFPFFNKTSNFTVDTYIDVIGITKTINIAHDVFIQRTKKWSIRVSVLLEGLGHPETHNISFCILQIDNEIKITLWGKYVDNSELAIGSSSVNSEIVGSIKQKESIDLEQLKFQVRILEENKRTLKSDYDKELNQWKEKLHILQEKYKQTKEDLENIKREKKQIDNLIQLKFQVRILEENKRTLKSDYDKELNQWKEKLHILQEKYKQTKEDLENIKREKKQIDNLSKEVLQAKDAEIDRLKTELLMQTVENEKLKNELKKVEEVTLKQLNLFQQHNIKPETTCNPIETLNPIVEAPTITTKPTETQSNPEVHTKISKPKEVSKPLPKLQRSQDLLETSTTVHTKRPREEEAPQATETKDNRIKKQAKISLNKHSS
ncbi:12786_t:CDS:2 [Entrophospora sp. SA101]|nr:12786_t:CDS:2 [Entrophospora sp. SA101]